MFTRISLPTFACAVLVFSFAGSADQKQAPTDPSEAAVRLRLNAIETSKLLEHYEGLVKRELSLQGSVRACLKSGDERLPQYQQALLETQGDLEETKKKLVTLESEKAKQLQRLGKKDAGDAPLGVVEKANRTLELILERLDGIEKRLEKIERRR